MKKMLALLMVLVMVLGIMPAMADNNVQTVVVWSDNAHEQSIREAQVAEFNATTGKELGIYIDYQVFGSDYSDTIKIALQNNDGPDLFRPSTNTLPQFVLAGQAVPISKLDGSEALLSRYDPSTLIVGDQLFSGDVYTLPYSLQSYKMIINKDLFKLAGIENAPKTWAEVREDARLITEASKGSAYGYFLALQSSWCQEHYIYSVNTPSMGHYGFDAVTGTYRYIDGLPVIESILGMIEDGSMFPGYANLDADTARAQFAAGRVGIAMGASFDVAVYTDQFPAVCEWEVLDPPAFTEDGYGYKEMVTAVNLLAVAKKALDSADTSKVAKVLEWFYADENLVPMYEQGMYLPYSSNVLALAGESNVHGWKGFSTFPDDQFIIRMADPKGVLKYEGSNARETIGNLLSGAYDQDAATVLKELDDRLNTAFAALDDETRAAYMAQPGYTVTREK